MPNGPSTTDAATHRDQRFAMRLSLGFGAAMLAGKVGAYVLTGSAAILSDAVESIIHVIAVAFAAWSLALSARPADRRYPYGYERIAFFSAGFEGAMIVIAAVGIIVASVRKWLGGLVLEQLGLGTLIVAAAAGVNALLGWYLVRTGRRTQSIILEANGKHVLTDSWTSVGVIGGLLLVMATGWKPFDPIFAIAVALNILWSGAQLMGRSVGGLMDRSDPAVERALGEQLDALSSELGIEYHALRFRHTGQRVLVEVHLLFPYDLALGEAHRLATAVEERLPRGIGRDVEVITHLEALEDHHDVHRAGPH